MPSAQLEFENSSAPLTVSQISAQIKTALDNNFPSKIRVVGEVSNLSDRKHWFFSLKDDNATLRCVCFASSVQRIKAPVKDGMQVVVTGRVDFYAGYGTVQIYVDNIEPVGMGALELALRQLMGQLRSEGYFALEHKKPLPVMPRKIAVVTSRAAAALQDVINTAARRWPGCQLYLVDVRVQGDQAAGQIAAAINALSKTGRQLGIDGVILTRGGGSIEDLWAFNEKQVADAIYNCNLPVVAAIGHETDTTIAELVADVRCSTPTQAAMQLVPDRQSLDQQIEQLSSRIGFLMRREIDHSTQRLSAIQKHALFSYPRRLVEHAQDNLNETAKRLPVVIKRRLQNETDKLQRLRRHLEAVGPDNVLGRGYSYTLTNDGKILRSAKKIAPGDLLTTVLIDGKIASKVTGQSAPKAPTAPKRKNAGHKRYNKNQSSLF